jgi:hexosaminidase
MACNPPVEKQFMNGVSIIPQPREISFQNKAFTLDPGTCILAEEGLLQLAGQLQTYFHEATGFTLAVNEPVSGSNFIELVLDKDPELQEDEAYQIRSTSRKIEIRAGTGTGLFYGIQTLRQLIPPSLELTSASATGRHPEIQLPLLTVSDSPRFKWRGLMLDCSRTFWDKAYIMKTIRLLAFYKMNVLHLHLTDDQGWRLQIDAYPELTQTGARFPEKWNEPEERQGYYSKEDIREILACAEKHHVTIVPEIEMPGHSLAALACYPGLSCTGGPFEIHPFFKGPGVHEDILCAGNDSTFDFLENVLTEVSELFPSEYIHIGGDEAPKARWEACDKCQARIEAEGLKDEHELQSWFIRQVEQIVSSHGKKLVGWDEILEGGLSPSATVMYWRGWLEDVPARVLAKGNDIVMSPTTHCYFDYDHRTTSTLQAYGFEPLPAGISEEESFRILGVQANFWSHIDRTEAGVDKQLYPRLLAVSEVAWSPPATKDTALFKRKVQQHVMRLEDFQVEAYPDSTIWH